MTFSLSAAVAALSSEKRASVDARIDELRDALPSGATVRDDSRLAFLWATGGTDWAIEEVAHEMACTQIICDKTRYVDSIEAALRHVALSAKQSHPISWTKVWASVREFGPDMVKLLAMDEAGLTL